MAGGGDSSDILMFFEDDQGRPLSGESTTDLTSASQIGRSMLKGFNSGSVFEIKSFGFSIGRTSDGNTKKAGDLNAKDSTAKMHDIATEAAHKVYDKRNKAKDDKEDMAVAVQEISFSRLMDRSSSELMRHFVLRTNFERAVLVKRKAAGSKAAGEPYLRFEFRRVLLTKANWSNDDPISEDYAFYCRAITMHYRPQDPDGTLGSIIVGFWSMSPTDKAERI